MTFTGRKPMAKTVGRLAKIGVMALANAGLAGKRATKTKNRLARKNKLKKGSKSLFEKVKVDGPVSQSFTRWRPALRRVKLGNMKRLCAPQYYVSNQTQRLTSTIGVQGISCTSGTAPLSTFSIYSIGDLTNIYNGLNTNGMLPTFGKTTVKIYHKSVTTSLMMTNQTNDLAHVQIYECTLRNSTANASYWNPGAAWAQGNTDQSNSGTYTIVGSLPFQTPAFTTNYKVEKVVDINLHAGGHHVHRARFEPKHLLTQEHVLEYANSGDGGIGGMTRFHFIVWHGYPVNDNTTLTQISTPALAIDCIFKKEYEYDVFAQSSTQVDFTNNLPAAFTIAPTLVSDLTGAVQVPVVA